MAKIIHKETYRKNTLLEPQTVASLISKNIETVETHALERGIMDNGDEYLKVKIYIPKIEDDETS